jgi:hypothetical protein
MTASTPMVEADLPPVSCTLTPRAAKALMRILLAAIRRQEGEAPHERTR